MQKLIEGIHQFQQTIFDTEKHLFERLAQPIRLPREAHQRLNELRMKIDPDVLKRIDLLADAE